MVQSGPRVGFVKGIGGRFLRGNEAAIKVGLSFPCCFPVGAEKLLVTTQEVTERKAVQGETLGLGTPWQVVATRQASRCAFSPWMPPLPQEEGRVWVPILYTRRPRPGRESD